MFKLEHLDDPPAAIAEFLLALKIDPDSWTAGWNLSVLTSGIWRSRRRAGN